MYVYRRLWKINFSPLIFIYNKKKIFFSYTSSIKIFAFIFVQPLQFTSRKKNIPSNKVYKHEQYLLVGIDKHTLTLLQWCKLLFKTLWHEIVLSDCIVLNFFFHFIYIFLFAEKGFLLHSQLSQFNLKWCRKEEKNFFFLTTIPWRRLY